MEYLLQIGLNTLVTASIYTLLGLSFSLIYSANKYFDMTLAAYIVLGSYSTFFLQKNGLPLILASAISLIFVAGIALLLERFYYEKIRKKGGTSFVFMIASLGVLTVAQALVAIFFTSNIQVIKTSSTVYRYLETAFTPVHVYSLLLTLVIFFFLFYVLRTTKLGAQLRAMSDNEELALTQGVNTRKLRLIIISAAAALAALAGILSGADSSIEPYMGMSLLFKGVIAAFILGLTNILYVPLGALILAVLENSAIWYISGEWKDVVAFGVLILIILIRPRGILSK